MLAGGERKGRFYLTSALCPPHVTPDMQEICLERHVILLMWCITLNASSPLRKPGFCSTARVSMMSMLQLGSPSRISEDFKFVPVSRHIFWVLRGMASCREEERSFASYYIHHVEDVITTFS